MSQFNHIFRLTFANEQTRQYKSENSNARIDFINDKCIRVAVYNDGEKMLPTFSVNPNNTHTVNGIDRLSLEGFESACPIIKDENIFALGDIEIHLDLTNFTIEYYKGNSFLFGDRKPLAYNLGGEFGNGCYHYVSSENGEKIYGLGDKGGSMDKASRAFRIETNDSMGYDAQKTDVLYKHIPFYICENSVGTYGIFYDTSDNSYIDCGNEINNYYSRYKYFKTEDNTLVYYVFLGSMLDIVTGFSKITGNNAFPPKWSFEYCASTMAYTDAPNSEEMMNGFLNKLKEVGLDCKGFYLSSGYTSIGEQRYVFNWNYDKFKNPKEFISRFSENSINIIPNIKPAFLIDHPMYDKINENDLFININNGEPFVTQFWDGVGSYLDFTNKSGYEFWKRQVKEKLLDFGITSTWNDNNEFDIKNENAYAKGFGDGRVKAKRIKPVLTQLMVQASFEAQTEKHPKKRPFLSSRSGAIGIKRYAQTWSGDNFTSFNDLKFCHNIGLTMSLSGLYFYGHDLGGFSGDMPSRELLLRWIQHGIFEPRFTIHSWNKDGSATMPWSYGDIIPYVKEIFSQRKTLMPYLYNAAYEAVEKHLPINAPVYLYYKDDELEVDSPTMMFGRNILVAFVFDEGKSVVRVYLPKSDDWYLNDKLIFGGTSVELTIPTKSKMPYFIKAGTVLPTDIAEYKFQSDENIIFTVYPIKYGKFESDYFDDDGETFEYKDNNCIKLHFTVKCDEDEVSVNYQNKGNKSFSPNIRLCKNDGRKLTINEIM